MTGAEIAGVMRRAADVFERVGANTEITNRPKPMLEGDIAAGAAVMLIYLRDLFTVANREQWDRAEMLVLLENVCSDAEIFPCGMGRLFWEMDNEEEDDENDDDK